METCVNQQNFYLGCRVCRKLLAKRTSVSFYDLIPDLDIKYSYAQAFLSLTELEVSFLP
jgi:hypothetical protein